MLSNLLVELVSLLVWLVKDWERRRAFRKAEAAPAESLPKRYANWLQDGSRAQQERLRLVFFGSKSLQERSKSLSRGVPRRGHDSDPILGPFWGSKMGPRALEKTVKSLQG